MIHAWIELGLGLGRLFGRYRCAVRQAVGWVKACATVTRVNLNSISRLCRVAVVSTVTFACRFCSLLVFSLLFRAALTQSRVLGQGPMHPYRIILFQGCNEVLLSHVCGYLG